MPFRRNHVLHIELVLFVIFWVLLAIHPNKALDWWMENMLNFAAIIVLAVSYRWFQFSTLSYTFILLLIVLHTFGAHYAYHETPVDRWMKSLFHFKRNMYDRIVHLGFGLLLSFPTIELLIRVARMRRLWAYLVAPWVLVGFGALYEIGEMYVAIYAPKKEGSDFLGMQGDIWDSERDMQMNLIGAITAVILIVICRKVWRKKTDTPPLEIAYNE
ncbi:putative membrane protein [Paenibacillus taihuensis]|uniref:Putative membrane protein n=1 Tax=Paenibacillus taihuensis TaxID=1156355 RepID=A0A3D9RI84_9BACL|nr:DUF2238 domain-containing protein [Paenibacillus taihuensis]REE78808.1 putative membrane protein [Paenibacillus taihuensis]